MARPTKYTEELAEAICKDIERGNTFRVAALMNGIAESTFHLWCEKHPEFSERADRAEATAEAMVVRALVREVNFGEASLIKFYLTHRNNDGWRPPKQTNEHTGADGGAIKVNITNEFVDYGDPDDDAASAP